jgi:O-6-methylguanine DNA methyltransferase
MSAASIHLQVIGTPIGNMWAMSTQLGLVQLKFSDEEPQIKDIQQLEKQLECSVIIGETTVLKETEAQLSTYFDRKLRDFNIPLDLRGSEFQLKIWNELLKVPYGQTITYMDQAKKFGDTRAVRAVAHANGLNPIAIIVPCHRIIGSNGDLTGYAGGIHRKRWLLDHESNQTALFSE